MTYSNKCFICKEEFDWMAPRFNSPNPECPKCGGVTERQITAPAIVWSKPLGSYADPKSEGFHKQQKAGGHWAMEKHPETGAVSKTFLATPQDQASYCKRNGLIDPKNLPTNLSISKDGRSYEKTNVSEI